MNKPGQKSDKGIEDLDEKIEVLRRLLDVQNATAVCRELGERTPVPVRNGISGDAMALSYKDWRKSRGGGGHDPLGPVGKAFRDSVAYVVEDLGARKDGLDEIIWHGSVDDLIDALPEMRVTSDIEALRQRPRRRADLSQIFSARHARGEDIAAAVAKRRLDQRHCYMLPSSADAWERIALRSSYGQYQACEDALAKMFQSGTWTNFCNQSPAGFVALGAGSASKDLLVMRRLAESVPPEARRMSYYLVDFSEFMLERTDKEIRDTAKRTSWISRFKEPPTLLKMDFFKIESGSIERPKGQPMGWGIFGGTIGNLNEAAFFESLYQNAYPGDCLFVSLETIPEGMSQEQDQEYRRALQRKYEERAIKELMSCSLHISWRYLNQQRDFDAAVDDIRAEVVDGRGPGNSAIDRSRSVEIYTAWNGVRVVIVASTRYDEEAFKTYARHFCFEHLETAVSPRDPHFKVLAFRRIKG